MTLGISFLFSVAITLGILFFRIQSEQKLAEGLSPYLQGLVSSLDRPELLRVTHSLKKSYTSDFIVTKNGKVISSTRDPSEMDQRLALPKKQFGDFGVYPIEEKYISEFKLADGQTLVLISSLSSFILTGGITFFLTLFICLFISWKSSKEFQLALKKALLPIDTLMKFIGEMHDSATTTLPSQAIKIIELDEIRLALEKAKREIENSRDLLAQKKAKELMIKKYEALIHDLHNPVTALSGVSKLLDEPDLSEQTKNDAIAFFRRIVPQILSQVTVAKENLGKLDYPTFVEVDLNQFTKEICSDFNFQKKTLPKISITLNENSSVIASIDQMQLRRALCNLIENAIHFSKEHLAIEVKNDGRVPTIRICDDGPGIDPEKLTTYMLGRGSSSNGSRKAYGLATANHIVKSHGGKLVYIRTPHGGSTFEIRLPHE